LKLDEEEEEGGFWFWLLISPNMFVLKV